MYKPRDREDAVWMHPGEPVFDRISTSVLGRFGRDALKGAVFIDPNATEPYLFHIALVSVEQTHGQENTKSADLLDGLGGGEIGAKLLDSQFVGLRQTKDGTIEEWPVEHLLLLRGVKGFAPSRVPLAALARRMVPNATGFARDDVIERLVQSHRQRLLDDLPARLEFVNRGFDYQTAELAAARACLTEKARAGDPHAKGDLSKVKERQRSLTAARNCRLNELRAEPAISRRERSSFSPMRSSYPPRIPKISSVTTPRSKRIAMKVAAAYEETFAPK